MNITRVNPNLVEVECYGYLYQIDHDTKNYGDFFRSSRLEHHNHSLRKSLTLKDAIMVCQSDAAFYERRNEFRNSAKWVEEDDRLD